MHEFVAVPVPTHLVTEVMRFIADHATVEKSEPDAPLGAGAGSRDWSKEQLSQLHESDAPSVKLFAQVLTLLADASPEPISVDRLAELTGIDSGLALQKKFGAVTRWMRNRIGGDVRWPLQYPSGGWAMDSHNAAIWKEINA